METTPTTMTKGTLKAEQLVPILDFLLKKELEKMKIAEFIENLQHLQDKFDYVDKLESLRIDDEVANVKAKVNQCSTDLQSTLKKYDEKLTKQNIEGNIGRLDIDNEIEEIKKGQEKLVRIYEEQIKLKIEQESSKKDIESMKKAQDLIKNQYDTITADQQSLKIEQENLKKYRQQETETDTQSNDIVWSKIMELQQNISSEREEMFEEIKNVQKTMALDQAEIKILRDKISKDRDKFFAEMGHFKKEYQTLKEELDKTKNLLQQVLNEQDKFKKESEEIQKEKQKIRGERQRKELERINDEKEKMRTEREIIQKEKERMQKEQEKMREERDKLLAIIARHQYAYDMAGPSSNVVSIRQHRENNNNIRPLLAIKPSDDSDVIPEKNYDNVTFHFDDSDFVYDTQTGVPTLKVESSNEDDDDAISMACAEDLPLTSCDCEDVSLEDTEGSGKFVQRYTVEEADDSEKSSGSNEPSDRRLVSMDFYSELGEEAETEDSLSD